LQRDKEIELLNWIISERRITLMARGLYPRIITHTECLNLQQVKHL